MMKFTRFVSNQAELGFPWGIAYADFMKDGNYWAIVPLNWVIRWARKLWWKLRFPKKMTMEEMRDMHTARIIREINRYKIDHDLPLQNMQSDKWLIVLICMQLEDRIKERVGSDG